jgi:NADPH-dependent 2,4-dienoyl-CoA reductase/sulfur reductase-like enzyme
MPDIAGDTLASALIANGVTLVGRSFKYHRPRGIFSAGSDEPNALVELRDGARREPNTRATTVELFDGSRRQPEPLAVARVRRDGDERRCSRPSSRPASTTRPSCGRRVFGRKSTSRLIRRAAGLGRAAGADDPDEYEKAFAHCDVLVIGAGPAGLMAALSAGRAGARVILADEDFKLGGRLLAERFVLDESESIAWAARIEAELAAMPEVTIMRRTTVFGVYDHGQYGAVERVSDHLAVPLRISRVSATGKSSPSAWCLPPARRTPDRVSPATIARASCWRRGADLSQSVCRDALLPSGCFHQQR